MKIHRLAQLAGLVTLLGLTASEAFAQNNVAVRFDPPTSAVSAGSSFAVKLIGDLSVPVAGWGLDLALDSSLLSIETIEVGPLWFAANAADGDNLAGLTFPSPVGGQGTLLATLHLKASGKACAGTSNLVAGSTPSDLAEGFPLPPGDFAEVTSTPGSVKVSDSLPPNISAALSAVTRLGGTFRVSFSASDNCAVASESGVMEVPGGFSGFRVGFTPKTDETSAIEIDFKKRQVKLRGSTQAGMMALLNQIAAEGGARVANGQLVDLAQQSDHDVVKLTFRDGNVAAVQAFDLRLTVQATDAAGNHATTTVVPSA
jgi:hypothetical protein